MYISSAKDIDKYATYLENGTSTYKWIRERLLVFDPSVTYFKDAWDEDFNPSPVGETQDDTTDRTYDCLHYVEVKGPSGIATKIIHEASGLDRACSSSPNKIYAINGNLRYYEIGDDPNGLYWVLGSLHLSNDLEWDDDKVLYFVYRSDQGFLNNFDAEFSLDFDYGSSDLYKFHIVPDLKTPDGGNVFLSGEFRLFRKTTKTKHAETSEQIEYRIPEHEVEV